MLRRAGSAVQMPAANGCTSRSNACRPSRRRANSFYRRLRDEWRRQRAAVPPAVPEFPALRTDSATEAAG